MKHYRSALNGLQIFYPLGLELVTFDSQKSGSFDFWIRVIENIHTHDIIPLAARANAPRKTVPGKGVFNDKCACATGPRSGPVQFPLAAHVCYNERDPPV